ncbi:NAD(P)/FAD-dependent oxidoreductase [Halococcus thailandensis]|uniref:Monooxygenase FAD-binding protein n=1 Tax=Halococcus thailandensis JCM 13552 TaxID=1227457 RepID=M0NHD1_9EURY|nr:FAD-dependent monooxygenase [Halococcus thailandensis]EMA56040.1 monooxygenase FAD-binding protein [Halococcus thailandensis JCM 13552]
MTLATVDRYDQEQVSAIGDRAVVVGGSMAGLCAARVLADGFDEVVIIERDSLPDEPVTHDGVPQSTHPHIMQEAGRATLEDFFPGFGEKLLSEGGLLIDGSTEVKSYDEGGFTANPESRLPMYSSSRALFEWVVRWHVTRIENVSLRDECQFSDYLLDNSETAVTGVAFRDEQGAETTLAADLVVDATGRTSRTPQWLEDHGYEAPPVDEVEVDLTYSTIQIERPPDDRRLFFDLPSSPRTRGSAFIPIEENRWEVIMSGVHGDAAPADKEKYVEFAESLPVDELGELVKSQSWVSDEIHQYPFPANRRQHYEQVDDFPDGLVVTGDAIASFNPIYGQGMAVAALDALLLHHCLADGGRANLAPRFFKRAAETIDTVWMLGVGADFDFPQTTGPKPFGTDLVNRYVARLTRQAHSDRVLSEVFARVLRLEQPPTTLFRPNVVWRVFLPSPQSSLTRYLTLARQRTSSTASISQSRSH